MTSNSSNYCGKVCIDASHQSFQIYTQEGPLWVTVKKAEKVKAEKFQDVKGQFEKAWDPNYSGRCPNIIAIWDITTQELLDRHMEYCEQIGNVRLHGSGTNP